MISKPEFIHKHIYTKEVTKKVLIAKHDAHNDGEYKGTQGYDILKQRVCQLDNNGKICGAIITYDMIRNKR